MSPESWSASKQPVAGGERIALLENGAPVSFRRLFASLESSADFAAWYSPFWLSTAGMGVSWLHVRLDERPKYYRFQEYRSAAR